MISGRWGLLFVIVLILGLGLLAWLFQTGDDQRLAAGGERGASSASPGDASRPTPEPRRANPESDAATTVTDRPSAEPRSDAVIDGEVQASAGFSFESVTVQLEEAWLESDDRPDFQVQTRPDSDGAFRFEGLDPERRYVVTIAAPGTRIRPYRSLIGTPSDLEALFDLAPIFGCAPRLLDPSGLELSIMDGRFMTFDRRQMERAGLEVAIDPRSHGLKAEDLDSLEAGSGLFALPRAEQVVSAPSIDLSFDLPGYENLRATIGLVELGPNTALPRPIFALSAIEKYNSVSIDLRYEDGGLPEGREELRVQRHGWKFEDCYAIAAYDLLTLPTARFRLVPGLHRLQTRDGRVAREFMVEKSDPELVQVVRIRIPRGGDIEFDLPAERGPYRLEAPVGGRVFDTPREVEAGHFVYRDLPPGSWCFAVTDRRGRRIEGQVELKGAETFIWRPFAD